MRDWYFLLDQFHVCRRVQVAGVAFIGVDMDFEYDLGVIANLDAVEDHAARAVDFAV